MCMNNMKNKIKHTNTASDFELKILQRVRFLQNFAKFSCVHQNRARFGNGLRYGMCSVSQVILLG